MKHRQLVPSIHSETLNPNIDFNNSPFYVQRELVEWKQPEVIEHGQIKKYPRHAGISSFVFTKRYNVGEVAKTNTPILLVFLSVFCVATMHEYYNMHHCRTLNTNRIRTKILRNKNST